MIQLQGVLDQVTWNKLFGDDVPFDSPVSSDTVTQALNSKAAELLSPLQRETVAALLTDATAEVGENLAATTAQFREPARASFQAAGDVLPNARVQLKQKILSEWPSTMSGAYPVKGDFDAFGSYLDSLSMLALAVLDKTRGGLDLVSAIDVRESIIPMVERLYDELVDLGQPVEDRATPAQAVSQVFGDQNLRDFLSDAAADELEQYGGVSRYRVAQQPQLPNRASVYLRGSVMGFHNELTRLNEGESVTVPLAKPCTLTVAGQRQLSADFLDADGWNGPAGGGTVTAHSFTAQTGKSRDTVHRYWLERDAGEIVNGGWLTAIPQGFEWFGSMSEMLKASQAE